MNAKPIIVEVGSRFLRAGLAGERGPRCVQPWEIDELLQTPRTKDEWVQELQQPLYDICFESLLVNPHQRRVVVCEGDMVFPHALREAIVTVALRDLKAASVAFAPGMLMAIYGTSNQTALIIDCGYKETRLFPIFQGIPLRHLYTVVPTGSLQCCLMLQKSLQVDLSNARDILERACFVQPMEPVQDVSDAKMRLSQEHTIHVPAALRSQVTEHLFVGNDQDGASIVEAVADLAERLPVDARLGCLSNLLLLGGTAMLPGFSLRLVEQVRSSLQQKNVSKKLTEEGSVAAVATYFPPNMLGWVGTSVYASAADLQPQSITMEQHTSGEFTLPDWLSVA